MLDALLHKLLCDNYIVLLQFVYSIITITVVLLSK